MSSGVLTPKTNLHHYTKWKQISHYNKGYNMKPVVVDGFHFLSLSMTVLSRPKTPKKKKKDEENER